MASSRTPSSGDRAHPAAGPDGLDATYRRARALAEEMRQADAERLLRHVLRGIGASRTPGGLTRARVILSLANVRAERGHVSAGLALLEDVAAQDADGELSGLVLAQRGLLLLRTGRMVEALACLDEAVPALADDPPELCRLLLNRGMVRLMSGDLAGARTDLDECLAVGTRGAIPEPVAKARFNLGYLAFLAGDLPGSLAQMDEAVAGLDASAGGPRTVTLLDRARVLLNAGLLREADAQLHEAQELFAVAGQRQDQAECELARAQLAVLSADHAQARLLAGAARRRFERRGSIVWGLLAELVAYEAGSAGAGRSGSGEVAERIAARLRAAGLSEDARHAELLAAGGFLAAGDRGRALRAARRAGPARAGDKIHTVLQVRQVKAALAADAGHPDGERRQLRAAMRELQRHQASFGSLDLQTAASLHGRAIANQGLRSALTDGRAQVVFEWVERSRALASRLTPVRPPQDPDVASLLQELRFVRLEQRSVELSGQNVAALRARGHALEQRIRELSWYAEGGASVTEPVSLAAMRRALQAAGSASLIAHLVLDQRIYALVVRPQRTRLVALGPLAEVVELIRRVRADLDVAATRLPAAMRRAVEASLRRSLDRLDTALIKPLALDGDEPLVLVPSGPLMATAWTMLASLRGRALSVARSATSWLGGGNWPAGDRALRAAAISGPQLERSDVEVADVAAAWSTEAVTGAAATAHEVLHSLGEADVVHVAAHGRHESGNPLFSALYLADGQLFGYDLALAARMPRHVVLSACDLGLVSERPGDEVLGMTAALLHAGTGSVVASVAKVGDDVAREVMPVYHTALRRGLPPSAALALAIGDRDDAPFVCFGSGW